MNTTELKIKVDEGLSTYQLANHFGKSQTTIRYWLRKHSLNTKITNKVNLNKTSDILCLSCKNPLSGNQTKFCCSKCKSKFHYKNDEVANTNTYERQKRVSKERKDKLLYMAGGCCKVCGYNKNSAALCFHHRDADNKVFNLDARKLSNTRWESILEEFEKCDLLCSNCHIELHNPSLSFPPLISS
jgi:hypothetical protein